MLPPLSIENILFLPYCTKSWRDVILSSSSWNKKLQECQYYFSLLSNKIPLSGNIVWCGKKICSHYWKGPNVLARDRDPQWKTKTNLVHFCLSEYHFLTSGYSGQDNDIMNAIVLGVSSIDLAAWDWHFFMAEAACAGPMAHATSVL